MSKGFWLSDLRPKGKPKRIISCVPSQTELLSYLGLQQQVVGISLFCVHPKEWYENKKRIGGTKSLKIDQIKSLSPDLILANKEENVKEQLENLAKDYPVFVTDVCDYNSALQSNIEIGEITGCSEAAAQLNLKIAEAFDAIQPQQKKRVIYLIWKDPYMTIGGDTFISSMIEKAGFINCCANAYRYPEISLQEIQSHQPDYVFLSSEPYPFKAEHRQAFVTFLSLNRIKIVDGEYFSWYGSRMLKAATYFKKKDFLL